MMPLHSRIKKAELNDDDRFDFLRGLHGKRHGVLRVDELHPSKDNDSYYIFLIWVDPDDEDFTVDAIGENIRKLPELDEWEYRVDRTNVGLIILHTWL